MDGEPDKSKIKENEENSDKPSSASRLEAPSSKNEEVNCVSNVPASIESLEPQELNKDLDKQEYASQRKNLTKNNENVSSDSKTDRNPEDQTEDNNMPCAKEEKQEEDVPEDFFDDFMKEDFMAGLDIVDEDEEESEENGRRWRLSTPEAQKNRNPEIPLSNEKKKIDHVKKFKSSPPGEKIKEKKLPKKIRRLQRELELRKLDKELEEMKKVKPSKPIKSSLDADHFDIRRDPEKTRQAIERDKIKTAKDKEKRRITDIIETGLVPPGMELEVDLEEVCGKDKDENLPADDLRLKIKSRRSRSKSSDRTRKKNSPVERKNRKKSRSPLLRRSRSRPLRRSPLLRRSPPLRRSRSPLLQRIRSPPLRHSPKWSPKRTPTRKKSNSKSRSMKRSVSPKPRKRSRSPRPPRRSRSRSREYRRPFDRRRRSRSPRGSRKQRSRSRSPKKQRKDEKMSFLEELAVKLNQTHPLPQPGSMVSPAPQYVAPQPVMAPVPVPVPPPPQFSVVMQPQPMQHLDPYDQNFFIGSPTPLRQPSTVQKVQINNTSSRSFSGKQDKSKLFSDQRIKLSDFLAIASKPQVSNSSSAQLQEKIKVIQRCQDAIQDLTRGQFSGPLIVRDSGILDQTITDTTVSPLLRRRLIQLPFTTPGGRKPVESFAKRCESLLHRIGMTKSLELKEENKQEEVQPVIKLPPKPVAPPPVPQNLFPSFTPVKPKTTTKSSGVQTDYELSACKKCARRNSILTANLGVQAGNPTLTFSVSTQVTEADFYSMIPKTQSLASLTPAQLLGKQSMISEPKSFEQFRANRNYANIPNPPQPPFLYMPTQQGSSLAPPTPSPLMSIRPLFGGENNKSQFQDGRRNNEQGFVDRRGGYWK